MFCIGKYCYEIGVKSSIKEGSQNMDSYAVVRQCGAPIELPHWLVGPIDFFVKALVVFFA